MRYAYNILVGKLSGKRPLRRPRCRWEDDIRMDIKETVCGYGLESSGSGYSSVVVSCVRSSEDSGFINGREILD